MTAIVISLSRKQWLFVIIIIYFSRDSTSFATSCYFIRDTFDFATIDCEIHTKIAWIDSRANLWKEIGGKVIKCKIHERSFYCRVNRIHILDLCGAIVPLRLKTRQITCRSLSLLLRGIMLEKTPLRSRRYLISDQ